MSFSPVWVLIAMAGACVPGFVPLTALAAVGVEAAGPPAADLRRRHPGAPSGWIGCRGCSITFWGMSRCGSTWPLVDLHLPGLRGIRLPRPLHPHPHASLGPALGHAVCRFAAESLSGLRQGDCLRRVVARGPASLHLAAGIEKFLGKALNIIVASSITYVLVRLIDLLVGIWRERSATENDPLGKDLLPIIRKTIKVFTLVVMVLVTSQNLGLNVTGLIASLSIGGLAVGFAAQDTLANLFGAVAVLIDKPFNVGDRIQLDSVDGTVEASVFGVRTSGTWMATW